MRNITKLSGLIVSLILLIGISLFFYVRSSLPKTEGEILVRGLSNTITITRDASGVPHIEGTSMADVSFALGFVHAQDRLWQMEMNRRIGAGRLSEVLGSAALSKDKFLRTVGFYQAAEQTYAHLSDETKTLFKAYTEGVNAQLATHRGALPPEFLILNIKPEKWTVTDSLVWMKMMSWDLSKNLWRELERMRLLKTLSPQKVLEILPPYPGDKPQPLPDFTAYYKASQLDLDKLVAALPPPLPEGAGSNNWVVDGMRTQSGLPLMANDPHLGLATPSLWYFAHLKTPSFNAIGATLPGLPGIILGRNDHIAWGYTNTAPDVQDLYLEQIDPNDPSRYKTPEGWEPFTQRQETIKIKDEEPVVITVRTTRHGPVISDVLTSTANDLTSNMVLALAWTGLSEKDITPDSAAPMMRAKNWTEFKSAIQSFTSPQQNMVYADVDGNIGFYAPALVPIRKAENLAQGRLPSPGWLAEYDWQGFIPFQELPHSYNPPNRQFYSANQKIIGEKYPHFITSDWAAPYRANRIAERLEQEDLHSMETFRDIQSDTYSKMAEDFLIILLTTKPLDELSRKALTQLSIWDGRMTKSAIAPLIFNSWMRTLNKAIYADELGSLFDSYYRQRPLFLKNVLSNFNRQGAWCDNIETQYVEVCADILQNSLQEALKDLQSRYGEDMLDWRWGEAHIAHSDHIPFSKVPPLDKLFDIKVPSMGDTYTVNVGRHNIADEKAPFTNTHAASIRTIYDFSNLDRSLYIHSTGQSGIFFSPFYDDMAADWSNMKYRLMTTDPKDYSENAIEVLTLRPNWQAGAD